MSDRCLRGVWTKDAPERREMSVGFAIVGAGNIAGVQVEATRHIPEARAAGRVDPMEIG